MNKLYEHSKFLMERYDHYYDSINNKGSFIIVLNTFMIGGVITLYNSNVVCFRCAGILGYLFVCFLLFAISSLVLTLLAIIPYLKSGDKSNEKYSSMIFFGSISDNPNSNFVESFTNQSEEEINNDMVNQIYQLATGLNIKFRKLKIASYLLLVGIIILFPLIYLLIIN